MDSNAEIEILKRQINNLEKENKLLRQDINKFRHAIDNSPATIVITDNLGQIEFANPAFEEITGYSINEVIGQNPRILKTDYHDREFYKELWRTLNSGNSWKGEFYNKKKNGDFYWEEAFIGPIKDDNDIIRNFIAIKLDVTGRKEALDKLNIANTDLKESNSTKDKLFSIIAHDLKNPFWAILSVSDLIVNGINSYEKKDILDMVLLIKQSAKTSYTLLENLLQWAKVQTGRLDIKNEWINLFALSNDIVLTLDAQAKNKNINLHVDIEKSLMVYIDENMLSTILRNLVSNSLKFTNNGGKVSILAKHFDDMIHITVSDNGIGIPENVIDRLFRIDGKYSTKGTNNELGTGLGLLICKEFISKMNGNLQVDSKEGVGSNFTISIPNKKE